MFQRFRKRISRDQAQTARQWHEGISAVQLSASLLGVDSFRHEAKERLEGCTEVYLNSGGQPPVGMPSRDADLEALIQAHTSGGGNPVTAILACLRWLSPEATQRRIESLANVEDALYLQFLKLVSQLYPRSIPRKDARIAHSLLRVLRPKPQDWNRFQKIYDDIPDRDMLESSLFPASLVTRVLQSVEIGALVHAHFTTLRRRCALKSVFDAVTWLKSRPSICENEAFIHGTRSTLTPGVWDMYMHWVPDYERISLWEDSAVLSPSVKQYLAHLFALEGPDTTGHGVAALKATNPEGYPNVPPIGNDDDSSPLERLLDVLDGCIKCGPSALNLFIHHSIDNTPQDEDWRLIRYGISQGDDTCKALVSWQVLHDESEQGLARIDAATTVLPHFPSWGPHENEAMRNISSVVVELFWEAEGQFASGLTGTGPAPETSGWALWRLGQSIVDSEWLQSFLPRDVLDRIRRHPSEDILRAIFLRVAACETGVAPRIISQGSPRGEVRQYLASVLGGSDGLDEAMTEAVLRELDFWKRPRDASQRDFAAALSRLPLPYTTYADCLDGISSSDATLLRLLLPPTRTSDPPSAVALIRQLASRHKASLGIQACWITLFAFLVRRLDSRLIEFMSRTFSTKNWLDFVSDAADFLHMVSSVRDLGADLRPHIGWWRDVVHKYKGLLEYLPTKWMGSGGASAAGHKATWIYLNPDLIVYQFLDVFRTQQGMSQQKWNLLDHLRPDGANVEAILQCLEAMRSPNLTARSMKLYQRAADRSTVGRTPWGNDVLSAFISQATESELPDWTDPELHLLGTLTAVLGHASGSNPRLLSRASQSLMGELKGLVEDTKALENKRREMQRTTPTRVDAILRGIGVRSSVHAIRSQTIGDELVDAVEELGDDRYLISFDLSGLSPLVRRGAGLQESDRLLSVKVWMGTSTDTEREFSSKLSNRISNRYRHKSCKKFCIHLGTGDGACRAQGWWDVRSARLGRMPASREPRARASVQLEPSRVNPGNHQQLDAPLCGNALNTFTLALSFRLYEMVRDAQMSPWHVYNLVNEFIRTPTIACAGCSTPLPTPVWKMTMCIRCSPLLPETLVDRHWRTKFHHLSVDPLAFDLLLTSIFLGVSDPRLASFIHWPEFLHTQLMCSLPLLSQVPYNNSGLSMEHEKMFAWISGTFRGFFIEAPPDFQIHGMHNTKQFLLVNASPEKHQNFESFAGGSVGKLVFHGTSPSALFSILTHGLLPVDHAHLRRNGNALGNGIYLAEEPSYSTAFAKFIGASWPNSAFAADADYSVLLACELVGPSSPQNGVHVVANPSHVMVRYVFLLPRGWAAPQRRHVEQAFVSNFGRLRTPVEWTRTRAGREYPVVRLRG